MSCRQQCRYSWKQLRTAEPGRAPIEIETETGREESVEIEIRKRRSQKRIWIMESSGETETIDRSSNGQHSRHPSRALVPPTATPRPRQGPNTGAPPPAADLAQSTSPEPGCGARVTVRIGQSLGMPRHILATHGTHAGGSNTHTQ